MSPWDSVRKNWLRSEKHTKITNPSLLRTIVKDELKESRQTLLDLQQKLADGSSKRGQEIPGKMLSDDPGQPLGISWVKNVSRRCFRDVVWCSHYSCLNCWIFGHSCEDPRWPKDLKLAFAATPTGRGLKGTKMIKHVFTIHHRSIWTTVMFWVLSCHFMPYGLDLEDLCRVEATVHRAGTESAALIGELERQLKERKRDRIHWFPLIHWSIAKHVYHMHHLLLLVR